MSPTWKSPRHTVGCASCSRLCCKCAYCTWDTGTLRTPWCTCARPLSVDIHVARDKQRSVADHGSYTLQTATSILEAPATTGQRRTADGLTGQVRSRPSGSRTAWPGRRRAAWEAHHRESPACLGGALLRVSGLPWYRQPRASPGPAAVNGGGGWRRDALTRGEKGQLRRGGGCGGGQRPGLPLFRPAGSACLVGVPGTLFVPSLASQTLKWKGVISSESLFVSCLLVLAGLR